MILMITMMMKTGPNRSLASMWLKTVTFPCLTIYPTQRWKRRGRLYFSTIDADVLNLEKQFVKLAFIAFSSRSEKVHAHNTFELQIPNW